MLQQVDLDKTEKKHETVVFHYQNSSFISTRNLHKQQFDRTVEKTRDNCENKNTKIN